MRRVVLASAALTAASALAAGLVLILARPPGGWPAFSDAAGVLIGTAVTAGIVGAVVAWAITLPAVKTLRWAASALWAFGDGETPERVPARGGAESAAVALALNDVTRTIGERIRALEVRNAQLEHVFQNTPGGAVVLDENGRIVEMSHPAAALLGTTPELSAGRVLDGFLPDIADAIGDSRSAAEPAAEEPPAESVVMGRQVRIRSLPISYNGNGGNLILLEDVTSQAQTERARREFVANVSHDLRTPITSLRALLDTLESGAKDDPAAAATFLGQIRVEVERLESLTEELLEVARFEAGQDRMEMRESDCGEIAKLVADRLTALAERSGITLRILPAEAAIPVRIDTERIGRAILNVIHNAVKFTPPGGQITVSADAVDGYGRITVRDTGVGIEPDDLPRVFERFFRSDMSRTGGGAGLGLAIAQRIVNLHRGEIEIESDGVDRGTKVIIALPLFGPRSSDQA